MRLSEERLDALLARARREVDEGLLPACQVAVGYGGEVVAFEAAGDATTTTRFSVFSCTKPLVAAAAWVLIGEGRLDPGTAVADLVPEFAANGKEAVTVEQVMLHTSGFPRETLMPPQWDTREGRLEAFADWKLQWEPGTVFEYHPTSAHWVLAEVIERITGADFRDAVQELVTDPVGLPRRVLGLDAAEQEDVAVLEPTGEPATADELEQALGVRSLPSSEATDAALVGFNRADVRAAGVPGAGAVMTAADLVRFYQRLLHDPDGIWRPDVLADATGNVRNRLGDPVFSLPASRTIGLVVAGDDGLAFLRGFGSSVSPRAFGHNGAGGQVAWADPATGVSFAYLTSGLDANVIRQFRRGMDLSTLAGALVEETGVEHRSAAGAAERLGRPDLRFRGRRVAIRPGEPGSTPASEPG